VILKSESSSDLLFFKSAALSKEMGLAKTGDTVVITAGVPLNTKGATNLMKVMTIE